MDVRGAAVPGVDKMEVGLLMSARAWLRTEPAMKDPRNTVMNCNTQCNPTSACLESGKPRHAVHAKKKCLSLYFHYNSEAVRGLSTMLMGTYQLMCRRACSVNSCGEEYLEDVEL